MIPSLDVRERKADRSVGEDLGRQTGIGATVPLNLVNQTMTDAAREVVLVLLALSIGDNRLRVPLDHLARNKVRTRVMLNDIGPQCNRRRICHRPHASSLGRGVSNPPSFGVFCSLSLTGSIESQAEF